MQSIINRLVTPTPSFFKTLRTIGLALTAVSGALLAAPVALPAAVITIAGYLAVGGSVAAVVSQLTTEPDGQTAAAAAAGVTTTTDLAATTDVATAMIDQLAPGSMGQTVAAITTPVNHVADETDRQITSAARSQLPTQLNGPVASVKKDEYETPSE